MVQYTGPTAKYGGITEAFQAGQSASQKMRLDEEEALRRAREQALREQESAVRIGQIRTQESRAAAADAERRRMEAATQRYYQSFTETPSARPPTTPQPMLPRVGVALPGDERSPALDAFRAMTPGVEYTSGGVPVTTQRSAAAAPAPVTAPQRIPGLVVPGAAVAGELMKAASTYLPEIPTLAFRGVPWSSAPQQEATPTEATSAPTSQPAAPSLSGVDFGTLSGVDFGAQGLAVSPQLQSPTETTLSAPEGAERPPSYAYLDINPLQIQAERRKAQTAKTQLQRQMKLAVAAKRYEDVLALRTKLDALDANDLTYDAQDGIISLLNGDANKINTVIQEMTDGLAVLQPRSDGLYNIVVPSNPTLNRDGLSVESLIQQVRQGTDAAWADKQATAREKAAEEYAKRREEEFKIALETAKAVSVEEVKALADRQGFTFQSTPDGLAVIDRATNRIGMLVPKTQKIGGKTATIFDVQWISSIPTR